MYDIPVYSARCNDHRIEFLNTCQKILSQEMNLEETTALQIACYQGDYASIIKLIQSHIDREPSLSDHDEALVLANLGYFEVLDAKDVRLENIEYNANGINSFFDQSRLDQRFIDAFKDWRVHCDSNIIESDVGVECLEEVNIDALKEEVATEKRIARLQRDIPISTEDAAQVFLPGTSLGELESLHNILSQQVIEWMLVDHSVFKPQIPETTEGAKTEAGKAFVDEVASLIGGTTEQIVTNNIAYETGRFIIPDRKVQLARVFDYVYSRAPSAIVESGASHEIYPWVKRVALIDTPTVMSYITDSTLVRVVVVVGCAVAFMVGSYKASCMIESGIAKGLPWLIHHIPSSGLNGLNSVVSLIETVRDNTIKCLLLAVVADRYFIRPALRRAGYQDQWLASKVVLTMVRSYYATFTSFITAVAVCRYVDTLVSSGSALVRSIASYGEEERRKCLKNYFISQAA